MSPGQLDQLFKKAPTKFVFLAGIIHYQAFVNSSDEGQGLKRLERN